MSRNNDSLPFAKKSHFNNSRDSYVDENGNYVYTRWIKRNNGKWEREVVATIPFTDENKDIIILLDQDDHDFDLSARYDEENADYNIRSKREKAQNPAADDQVFDTDPIEEIPDSSNYISDDDPAPEDPMIQKIADFIRNELSEEQQNLLFAHLGEGKFLEDIRREEEAVTGKKVSKQAVHNRWNRIVTKACKHFGVNKPKQQHKINKDQ